MKIEATGALDGVVSPSAQGVAGADAAVGVPGALAERFQELMRQSQAVVSDAGVDLDWKVSDAIDQHLDHYARTVEKAADLVGSGLTASEMFAASMEMQVELTALSMNSTAYLQLLTNTKDSVTSLMRNQ